MYIYIQKIGHSYFLEGLVYSDAISHFDFSPPLGARLVTCIRRGQTPRMQLRAFGWLVGGWGLSHAVQDSLVSQAQLIRQKSLFLPGQARASAASMQMGHVVRQPMLACSEPNEISEQPGSVSTITKHRPCACARPGYLQPGCPGIAWLI